MLHRAPVVCVGIDHPLPTQRWGDNVVIVRTSRRLELLEAQTNLRPALGQHTEGILLRRECVGRAGDGGLAFFGFDHVPHEGIDAQSIPTFEFSNLPVDRQLPEQGTC